MFQVDTKYRDNMAWAIANILFYAPHSRDYMVLALRLHLLPYDTRSRFNIQVPSVT